MRILTCNLQHGGGQRVDRLASAVEAHHPDVMVFTEYRDNAPGRHLLATLDAAGWRYQATSEPARLCNGVSVVSREPFRVVPLPESVEMSDGRFRWLECDLGALSVVATYVPLNKPKLPFWAWYIEQAAARAGAHTICIGDFNTGKHRIDEVGATFRGAEYMDRMEALGYVDAWRVRYPEGREYSWFSNKGKGFRLDYAFLSASISPCLRDVFHDHSFRESGLTDHSALVVDLSRVA